MTSAYKFTKRKARGAATRILRSWGDDVIPAQFSTKADRVIARALQLAGPIGTVIDVGAAVGNWSIDLQKHLPGAQFLLFEAAPFHAAALRKISRPNFSVEYAAASDHKGHVSFALDPSNPLGGGASSTATEEHTATVPCITIDEAVASRALTGPYLVKLDTQGHEREILRGAAETIRDTSMLWIETYGVGQPGRPPFDELCLDLRELGFRAAGMADVMVRPSDEMLWQMDMFFLPASNPAFENTSYWR